MSSLTESYYSFEFLIGEKRNIQADKVTIASGQNLVAGALLAKTFVGTAAGANAAGNTGNPTIGAITVGSKAEAGTYQCIFTDATHCDVFSPGGVYLGSLTLGSAFTKLNRLTFTITAGVTPAVAGDIFNVFVTEGASVYVAATGSDAVAILGPATDATSGAIGNVPVIARLGEYNKSFVNYGSMDAAHILAADAALAKKNLIARVGVP